MFFTWKKKQSWYEDSKKLDKRTCIDREEEVDEALKETFPASDPPCWMSGNGFYSDIKSLARRSVWKFTPVARKEDPHWKEYEYRRPLLVEAGSPDTARLKATLWYKKNFQGFVDVKPGQFYRSAFEDEKLYEMSKLQESAIAEEEQKYPVVR